MGAALIFAVQVLQVIDVAVKVGGDVAAIVGPALTALTAMKAENRDPTAGEWQALNGIAVDLMTTLHKAASA